MHDAIADGDIAAAKIGPRLLLQSRHQLEPDLAVGFVVLVHPADHRCERWIRFERLTTPTSLPSRRPERV